MFRNFQPKDSPFRIRDIDDQRLHSFTRVFMGSRRKIHFSRNNFYLLIFRSISVSFASSLKNMKMFSTSRDDGSSVYIPGAFGYSRPYQCSPLFSRFVHNYVCEFYIRTKLGFPAPRARWSCRRQSFTVLLRASSFLFTTHADPLFTSHWPRSNRTKKQKRKSCRAELTLVIYAIIIPSLRSTIYIVWIFNRPDISDCWTIN